MEISDIDIDNYKEYKTFLMKFLRKQEDISDYILNSNVEVDYNSFSLSGVFLKSNKYLYVMAGGFDLGCGVGVYRIKNNINLILKNLYLATKTPFGISNEYIKINDIIVSGKYSKMLCDNLNNVRYGDIEKGNHFIEFDKNNKGEYYLVIHSGVNEKIKLLTAYIFSELYNNGFGNSDINSYDIRLNINSREADNFLEYSNLLNYIAKRNRSYIANNIANRYGFSIETILDNSHQFIFQKENKIIHSNGIQILTKLYNENIGILLGIKDVGNYIIHTDKDISYINHSIALTEDDYKTKGKDNYFEYLLSLKDYKNKLKDYELLKPIINCKKYRDKYVYS